MLAIGRALMGKPKLLLLVEQNARASLAISDWAYVLETGQVGLSGPAAELAVNPELTASYLGG